MRGQEVVKRRPALHSILHFHTPSLGRNAVQSGRRIKQKNDKKTFHPFWWIKVLLSCAKPMMALMAWSSTKNHPGKNRPFSRA